MSAGGPSAGTNGFLFCDLRGYTAFVEHHGDQAAAELLATYRELVRTAIATHAGAEIKTEGDSVYVVFPAASAAVEAGLEIVAAAGAASTKERPIRVGVGIHAGETVATTEGLVGGAVNIAARVCAKAQAGEVLVTDTVRALTRTYLPYRYTSLGTQQLKGIAGGIPLYRVEAVPSSARARLGRQLGARRGRVLVLAGARRRRPRRGIRRLCPQPPDRLPRACRPSTKDVVAKIDPARNCVVATYPVGHRPGPVVATKDAVWVAAEDAWLVQRLDEDGRVASTVGVPGTAAGMTSTPTGDVVVLIRDDRTQSLGGEERDRLGFIIGSTGRVRQYTRPPSRTSSGYASAPWVGITYANDRVWITNPTTGEVTRIRIAGVDGGSLPFDVAIGIGPIGSANGAVWLAHTTQPTLYQVTDPAVAPRLYPIGGASGTAVMATSPGTIWLARTDGRLTRIRHRDRSDRK